MPTSTPSADLERRKQVRLRLRPNLTFHPEGDDHGAATIVRDPVTLAYFRLDAGQYFVARLMDGTHTFAEIQQSYEHHFRPARLTLEELEDFARQLLTGGLVQSDATQTGSLLLERDRRRRRQALWARLLNPFCVRLPLIAPERLLDALLPIGRLIFARGFVMMALLGVLAAAGLITLRWAEFRARMPALPELMTWHNLLLFWLVLGLVKVLHELGHGLCCKVLGGQVREAGVLVLFFFPALYCDVSDSWTLRGKWRRIAVAAAGVYVELLIAADAVFVWACADPASLTGQISLALVLVCGVQTVVCNANPLMRFDGYYALADWLEVPNLADSGRRCLESGVLRWLGVPHEFEVPPGPIRPFWLACYALASHVYRCVVVFGTLYAVCTYLSERRLGSVGRFLVLLAALSALAWPSVRFYRALRGRGRLPTMKPLRAWLTTAVLALLMIGLTAIPWPIHVRGLALVQPDPDHLRRVTVPEAGGFLAEVRVRDGQRVQAGEILAVLVNPRLEVKLRLAEADQALRLRQRAAYAAQLAEPAATNRDAEPWQRASAELRALDRLQTSLREQHARLTLRAPCAGVVLGLRALEDHGRWLEKGDLVCSVGADDHLRAVLLVEPADRKLLTPGAFAQLRVHGGGSRLHPGTVQSIALTEAKDVPPQLAQSAGGEISTHTDQATKAETPRKQHYLVAVRLDGSTTALHPGALGRVRVRAGAQTVWWRARRYLATTFGWGL